MPEISISRFFNNKFWYYHLIGWHVFLMYEFFHDQLRNFNFSKYYLFWFFLEYLPLFVLLIILRIPYRKIYKKIKNPAKLILIALLASIICSLFWVGIRTLIIDFLYNGRGYWSFTKDPWNSMSSIIVGSWVPFAWSILYFGIKFWRDMVVEKNRAKEAAYLAQKAQLQTLRYQLNPHFLFNSLNSIQALFRENADQADLMITELSEFLRYSLKYNERVMIPVEEEIDIVRKYLTIEKIRYEEKLNFCINVDDEAVNKEIPCLITQPLVENSIKHGLYKNPEGIRITVNVKATSDFLKIQVKNTGMLMSGWEYGTGLKNVKERLQKTYKDKFSFLLTELDNSVMAQIEILLINHEKNDGPDN